MSHIIWIYTACTVSILVWRAKKVKENEYTFRGDNCVKTVLPPFWKKGLH